MGLKKRKPLKLGIPDVGCPFCWQWLPTPARLPDLPGSDSLGGRCECGAFFVLDVTGRSGGQALLDVQTLASGGDVDQALKLREGEHFELKSKPVRGRANPGGLVLQGHSYLQPQVWAIKLKQDSGE
jgi:hypothetical protein